MTGTNPSTDPITAWTESTMEPATTPSFPPPPVVGGGTPSPHSYCPTTPFLPLEPTMGGVAQVKHDKYSAWAGGNQTTFGLISTPLHLAAMLRQPNLGHERYFWA